MSEFKIIEEERSCGGCTMCCKLLGIESISKPAGRWCPECSPGVGCNVYAERPEACVKFKCMWLNEPGLMIFPQQRPDRSHVIFWVPESQDRQISVNVDPAYPDAWNALDLQAVMNVLVATGWLITIEIGDKHKLMCTAETFKRVFPSARISE